MDENNNKNDLLDLGSEDVEIDFDPFAEDEMADDSQTDISLEEADPELLDEDTVEVPVPAGIYSDSDDKATALVATPKEAEKPQQDDSEKPPVFEYAGATEAIEDTSKTFDELRIEKSSDFPELEDGKRVSWTVEYGKITKTVADPKGMSIGKMKSDIESSKEFADSLKKRGADKNPICKVKPRVTAQSKGTAAPYRGVFTSMEDADAAGKVISIIPAKDGKVYEVRCTEMGKFITPVIGCEFLSDVRAGFIPALPLIPMDLMMRIVAFFRYYMSNSSEQEVLVNVYWDTEGKQFLLEAPEQTVTKVSVNSKASDDYASSRYIHYMDIHSHNSMKAYFSAVDDKDEKATRLYTVIGNLQEYFPYIKTRISNGGKFCEIDPGEVFELIAKPFPDDWKSKVHFGVSHEVDYAEGDAL